MYLAFGTLGAHFVPYGFELVPMRVVVVPYGKICHSYTYIVGRGILLPSLLHIGKSSFHVEMDTSIYRDLMLE